MRTALACLLACGLALAGCVAPGPGGTPTATDPSPGTPPSTPTPVTPTGNASAGTLVFDHAHTARPVIEGGLVYPDDATTNETYYATLVRNATEADRFDRERLPADAREFVASTDFSRASLVVVQAFPKSSVPDYRVESVTRDGATVSVHLNDSSLYGTDDITVETVLIRVRAGAETPLTARITTQTGVAFDTDDGVTVDQGIE